MALGTPAALDRLLRELKDTEFTYTVQEDLQDYLSCEVIIEKLMGWLGQPHMIKKIIKTFVEEVKGLPTYKTPGSPNMSIAKPKEGESIIEEE